ncbi:hypothetical protein BH11ARM2_BH11ARM2_17340 [soil metagenome]
MSRSADYYLADAIAFCERVIELGDRSGFPHEQDVRELVHLNLILLGEAVTNLVRVEPIFDEAITERPSITRFRNNLTHRYWRIDPSIVREVVKVHVPLLLSELKAQLPE